MKKNKKKVLIKYFIDIVVMFIGISISIDVSFPVGLIFIVIVGILIESLWATLEKKSEDN